MQLIIKTRLSIITASLLFGMTSSAWGVATDGTYNFGSFTDGGNNLTSTDFTLSGTGTLSSPGPFNMTPDGTAAYGDTTKYGECVYKLTADGTNTYSFELTGIDAAEYDSGGNIYLTGVYVVGNVASGGTVPSDNTIAGTSVADTFNTAGLGLTNFSGVQLTSIELRYTAPNALDHCGNMNFNSFSISNATAPSSNNAPTASNFTYSTDIGSSAKTFDWKVLSSAADADNHSLSATVKTDGTKGYATISGDNITYTPKLGYTGSDSVIITISDSNGGEVDVTITLNNISKPASTVADANANLTFLASQGFTHNDGGCDISYRYTFYSYKC